VARRRKFAEKGLTGLPNWVARVANLKGVAGLRIGNGFLTAPVVRQRLRFRFDCALTEFSHRLVVPTFHSLSTDPGDPGGGSEIALVLADQLNGLGLFGS
jgi:hypothetical protein